MGILAKGWRKLETWMEKCTKVLIGIAKKIKKLAKDDPRRVIHSLKMALALTLVSLFYYVRPLYDGFGVSGMWAVLTVVVVFEFSVGATISKGLNRGFATLMAAVLGVGVQHLAILFGKKGEPYVIGFFVFLLASTCTFTRFFPGIKRRYDYGVLIFILTFSLVAVSGYRVNMILELASQRLSTILVGGATCMIVSVFVCPVWAGKDLHILIVHNIEKLAIFLEGFGEEYFKLKGDEMGNSKMDGKAFLQSHKSVLASKSPEESLANFARWEPCHGRFKLRHPWKQYLKVGALTRQCAYQIETLSSYINSEVKAPLEFRRQIQESCTKMSKESSKALRALASSIETMMHPKTVDIHVENSKNAVKELENILKAISYAPEELLALVPDATVASILVNITQSVDKISEAVHELAKLAHFKAVDPTVSPETKPVGSLLHRGIVKPVINDGDQGKVDDHVAIIIRDHQPEKHGISCTEEIVGSNAKNLSVNNTSSIVSPPPPIPCM